MDTSGKLPLSSNTPTPNSSIGSAVNVTVTPVPPQTASSGASPGDLKTSDVKIVPTSAQSTAPYVPSKDEKPKVESASKDPTITEEKKDSGSVAPDKPVDTPSPLTKSDTTNISIVDPIQEESVIQKILQTAKEDDSVESARLVKMAKLIAATKAPEDLKERAAIMMQQGMSSLKYGQIAPLEQAEQYVNVITKLPWGIRSQDNLELGNVKQMLNKNHYGMDSLKERIIEYLAVLKLQKKRALELGEEQTVSKAPIVCFVGLVGTGKTTVAYSIAEAMGRKFVRIPFGGMGSAADLRGESRIHPDAEPGLIIKAFIQAGVMNPVILLDEVDRVTEAARADIMGVLVEVLDPKQNMAFVDHYLDFPFNLSETIFIGTANNTKHIATAVMDRIEPLQMPSYSDKEKIVIGRDYVLPKQLKNCGLRPDQLKVNDDIWQKIVRPSGFDAGIRTLERTVNGICRKTARIIIEGKATSVTITEDNLKQFVQAW